MLCFHHQTTSGAQLKFNILSFFEFSVKNIYLHQPSNSFYRVQLYQKLLFYLNAKVLQNVLQLQIDIAFCSQFAVVQIPNGHILTNHDFLRVLFKFAKIVLVFISIFLRLSKKSTVLVQSSDIYIRNKKIPNVLNKIIRN